MASLLDEFAAQPEAKRTERLADMRRATQIYRQAKNMEYPQAKDGIKRKGESDDPLWPTL